MKYSSFLGKLLLPLLIVVFAAAFPPQAQAKTKLNDLIYSFIEVYLGTPTYQALASDPGFYQDSSVNGQLANVAARLNAVSKNQRLNDINVLNTSDINAYAVPGGHIFMLRGIYQLLDDEDQLACVVGHELGHLEKRHSVKQFILVVGIDAITRTMFSKNKEQTAWLLSQFLGYLYSMKFSRDEEMEADTLSLQYVRDAGYDPRACVTFMGKLQDLEQKDGANFTLASTHPKASDRIANMQTWLAGNFSADTYAGGGGAIVKPDDGSYAGGSDGDDDGNANAYTDDGYDSQADAVSQAADLEEYFGDLEKILNNGDEDGFAAYVLDNREMSRQALDALVEYAADNPDNAESYDTLRKAIEDILDSE